MSMLQKILDQMYVEPELLAQLDEEQKQILFIKMREEQIKRWKSREEEMDKAENATRAARNPRKAVKWLSGPDGAVWVWVMGEHASDRSIEDILQAEAMQRARELAESELNPGDSEERRLKDELQALDLTSREEHAQHNSVYEDANSREEQQTMANGLRGSAPPLPPPRPEKVTKKTSSGALDWPSLHQKPSTGGEGKLESDTVVHRIANPVARRQSEIYDQLRQKHTEIIKEAEREAEIERNRWEQQERKAREAEASIRSIAQKAREQHRQQSLRTSTSILPALLNARASSLRDAIKNLPRPPKPKSRNAIVEWFVREELPRGTGLDPKTRLPAPWFHGIISRTEAEILLTNKPTGSFLVRVSERIWGYTVSYVVGDGSSKHFLVERIPNGYQFLGTNQVVHDHLYDLIIYHETAPITAKGNEVLKWSVGQTASPPDYADLLAELQPSQSFHF